MARAPVPTDARAARGDAHGFSGIMRAVFGGKPLRQFGDLERVPRAANAASPARFTTAEDSMPIDSRHPREIRADIRRGVFAGVTAGLAPGFVQANLAILPKESAYDFLLFCQRNPRPCPLIEVTDVGSPEPVGVAPGADLRTDLPRYRIYKDGVMADEVTDITPFWRDDLVAF